MIPAFLPWPAGLEDLSTIAWTLVLAGLVLGGFVKGVLGVGLPLIAVPIMSLGIPTPLAIGLMAAPILGSNLVQVAQGRQLTATVRRFWRLALALALFSILGVYALKTLPTALATLSLGVVVIVFAAIQLGRVRLTLNPRHEGWASPLTGATSGFLGGITGFYGPPVIMYLTALSLAPEVFVATISAVYVVASVSLFSNLALQQVIEPEVFVASAAAFLPVMLGMVLGQRIRRHLPIEVFRKAIMVVLIVIGTKLIWQAVAEM